MNSKLPPMNTNYRSIPLQSGQAFAVGGHGRATLFLTEGEVLLHAPAQWLSDTVVQSPPRRVAAPATLRCEDLLSITALGAAQVYLEEAPGPLEKLKAAWKSIRMPAPLPAR